MIFFNANELYLGIKIIQDKEPCIVIENEFIKPGKGQAFNRIKLRKLISNKIVEKIFKSNNKIELANVINIVLTFLYKKNDSWFFIDKKSFDQYSVNENIIGDNAKWLVEQIDCNATLWNNIIILIILPNFINLKVISTSPSLKGNTIGYISKEAKLITGANIKVPSFIKPGNIIKVDTRSGEYVSRIK